MASAEVARAVASTRQQVRGGDAWIDYYGPEGTFPKVSFSTVYLGHVPRGFFTNKIVVVGPSAPTLQDIHPTSTARQMPGAEVQASAIETVLRGLPLRSSPTWLDVALIVLLGLAAPTGELALRADRHDLPGRRARGGALGWLCRWHSIAAA